MHLLLFVFLFPFFFGVLLTEAASTCFLPGTPLHNQNVASPEPRYSTNSFFWSTNSRTATALVASANFPKGITDSLMKSVNREDWFVFVAEAKDEASNLEDMGSSGSTVENANNHIRYRLKVPAVVLIARLSFPISPTHPRFYNLASVKLSFSSEVDSNCQDEALLRVVNLGEPFRPVNQYRVKIVEEDGSHLVSKVERDRWLESFHLTLIGTWTGPRYRLNRAVRRFERDETKRCYNTMTNNAITFASYVASRLVPNCGTVSKVHNIWLSSDNYHASNTQQPANEQSCTPDEQASNVFLPENCRQNSPDFERQGTGTPVEHSPTTPEEAQTELYSPTGFATKTELQDDLKYRLFDAILATSPDTPKPTECKGLLDAYKPFAEEFDIKLPLLSRRFYCGRILVPNYSRDSQTTAIGETSVAYSFLPAKSCIRGETCKGALLRGYGGPGFASITKFWREAEKLSSEYGDAEMMVLRASNNPATRVSVRKAVFNTFLGYAREYAQRCQDNIEEERLQNIGTVSAADDAGLITDTITTFLTGTPTSNAPLTVWAISWDARLPQVLAVRQPDRDLKGVIVSAVEVNLGDDWSKGYSNSLDDFDTGLNYFSALCYSMPSCKLHDLDTEVGIKIRSKSDVRSVLEWVLSDDRAKTSCSLSALWQLVEPLLRNPTATIFDEFAFRIHDCFLTQMTAKLNWHHDYMQIDEQWANARLWRRFGTGQSTGGASGSEFENLEANIDYKINLIRCVDADNFGATTDIDSVMKAYNVAQKVSKIGSHVTQFPYWILCAYFTEAMKSAVKVPTSLLQDASTEHDAPFLFLSDEHDSVTPRKNMIAAQSRFPKSKFVYQKGSFGHALPNPNAYCRHPQGTHPSNAPQDTSGSQTAPTSAQPLQNTSEVQYLGQRRTPAAAAAMYGVTGVIPTGSAMQEVNSALRNAETRAQQERAREVNANLPRVSTGSPLHLNMLQGSLSQQALGLGSLAPDTMEVAVVLFTRIPGNTASRKPFVLRQLFVLTDNIPNWHIFLQNMALSHPAWTERNMEDGLQYDNNPVRGIYVGEVVGRECEPAVRWIQRDFAGTVRQLLYFAFPRGPSETPTGLTTMRKNVGRKPSGALRSLALMIPVIYQAPKELEVAPPMRMKKEKNKSEAPEDIVGDSFYRTLDSDSTSPPEGMGVTLFAHMLVVIQYGCGNAEGILRVCEL
ncbi:hypothetical protein BJ508DRAFT_333736 [Ascobolus immersus RN42]|uniref:Peptidase S33 tripeptidyl aminopeptidase-like C-terminal domain-containing protein n=1 Tax=Ascobolus immersus RN42 TaxID=1160509 RepID=A0A3N4HPM6_ASCIM|nr:hypothetical protein BJ508DRAFT_333736 [Ascobolus immersus RN42]